MGYRRFLPSAHTWRKKKTTFNGNEDHRLPPTKLMGHDVLQQLENDATVQFYKGSQKRKCKPNKLNWTKQIIFFQLPY